MLISLHNDIIKFIIILIGIYENINSDSVEFTLILEEVKLLYSEGNFFNIAFVSVPCAESILAGISIFIVSPLYVIYPVVPAGKIKSFEITIFLTKLLPLDADKLINGVLSLYGVFINGDGTKSVYPVSTVLSELLNPSTTSPVCVSNFNIVIFVPLFI